MLGHWREGIRAVDEALHLMAVGSETIESYVAHLVGAGGKGSPPGPLPSSDRRSSGWDSAPDLVVARDRMTGLGEIPIMREVHILDGDDNGRAGGHRWDSTIPGKTKFPREWDDDKILDSIRDIAHRPDRTPVARPRGGWECEGVRDGVTIAVVMNDDGSVWTAFPLSGQDVERNPR